MKRLLLNEWKRIFKSKIFYVNILIVIGVAVLLLWYCVATTGSDIAKGDGTSIIVKGKEAIKVQRQYDRAIEGKLDNKKLIKGLNILKKSYDVEKDKYTYSKELFEYGTACSLISSLLYIYPESNNISFNNYDDIPNSVAENFYQYRDEKLIRIWSKNGYSGEPLVKKLGLNSKIKRPFEAYENYSSWQTILEYLSLFISIIMLLGLLFGASIFSETYQSGADEIIRTTKYGRKHAGIVKILACFLYTILLFTIGCSILLGGSVVFFGGKALKTSLQVMNVFSVAPLTFGGALVYQIVGGIIGCMAMTALTVFLSAKMNKSSIVLFISIGIFGVYEVMSFIIKDVNQIIETLLAIYPASGAHMIYALQGSAINNIFGVYTWGPTINLVSGIVWIIVMSGLALRTYIRREC